MKLVSRFKLAAKNKNELYALLREAFSKFVGNEPETHQRGNALASIKNIQREISSRAFRP